MKTVFVLFDSLNRHALECYGGEVATPNFSRFCERAVTFENHYAGSLPCMPARRDLHTGRLNFLHRSWGPLEPFDASMPEILKENGVYTHLISDHYHYWEDGGSTYHNRYSSWEFFRGQEWDPWGAMAEPPDEKFRKTYHDVQYDPPGKGGRAQSMVNREHMGREEDFPLVQCFDATFQFLDRNRGSDKWMLNLECFDPHEPFHAPERFRHADQTDYQGPTLDWPRYRKVRESDEEIAEIRANNAALLRMCDEYFGRLLDYFDEHDLWKDTALIVSTDHGHMLGEHDWWAKNRMPFYNEVCRIPLMMHHPDFADQAGTRRVALSQTIDLMPTLLEMNGVPVPKNVEGVSLTRVLEKDEPIREALIYGMFGAATNITDGRYTYFKYPSNLADQKLFEYTLMPMHTKTMFEAKEYEGAELINEFGFTGGYPLLRLPARADAKRPPGQGGPIEDTTTVLYDLDADPGQNTPVDDPATVARLEGLMIDLMARNEAPPEAFERLGFKRPDPG
ncbi:MAG: sulfatase [Rhodospirillales bacterium]|jgi:arylsulfatase A-like enzyme|nr:sulfatase [Rhodospirillales bacterium]